MVAAIRHRQRFGETLRLVVHTPRPDRVDVSPVTLGLRVHLRVAVRLGCRSKHEPCALVLRHAEHVQRADRADLHGLDRQLQVVDRRGRRGEVIDHVDVAWDVDVVGDVGPHHPELRVGQQVLDVRRRAGEEVVDADDVPAVGEQPLADVRAQEAGAPGDDRPAARLICHESEPIRWALRATPWLRR